MVWRPPLGLENVRGIKRHDLNQLAGGLRLTQCVSALYPTLSFRPIKGLLNLVLPLLLLGSPARVFATVSASLTWLPSADPSVAGYKIYYGGASHQYTNVVAVGAVTNAVIPGLSPNTTYFFAATSLDSAGDESDFSNEAAYAGMLSTTEGTLHYRALPTGYTSDALTYSLDANAPAGMTINATTGLITWAPGNAFASTTNYINVTVTDATNPNSSITETVVVIVGDYLEFHLASVAATAGQNCSLPLNVAASSSVTNLQITLGWPAGKLLNPQLTFFAPIVAASMKNINNQLVIQLQTTASLPLTGTNLVAQVSFQAATGTASTILGIPAAAGSGSTAAGTAYANVQTMPGEVVVVGSQPMLRPLASANGGRSMSLYAAPGIYQLQSATSLANPVTWSPVMTYAQTNVAQTVSLDTSNTFVFYRLQQF
jgi:hypothetical protein